MAGWGAILGIANFSASTAANVYGQSEANKTNISLANKNRDWQEHMASTRYQRTMADMKLAGLNPILAYKQGGGPVPAGNVANVTSEFSKVGEGVQRGVTSAMAFRRQNIEVKNLQQDNVNKVKEGYMIDAQYNKAVWERNNLMEANHSARTTARIADIDRNFYNTPSGQLAREAELWGKAASMGGAARLGVGAFANIRRARRLKSAGASKLPKMPPKIVNPNAASRALSRRGNEGLRGKPPGGNWKKFVKPNR